MKRTPDFHGASLGIALAAILVSAASLPANAQTQDQQQPPSVYGSLYVDADGDGQYTQGEPGIPDVTVELRVGNDLVGSARTDTTGKYVFYGAYNGALSVPQQTQDADMNESLANWFSSDTWSQSAAPGVPNNFSFNVDVAQLLNDFNPQDPDGDGFTFNGNGRTIGFWKHQLAVAMSGKGKSQVDATTLSGYLDAIEALALPDPFQFEDGFQSAYDILKYEGSDPLQLLLKQLLGTEFNTVAGYGLSAPYSSLQSLLVAWGEFLAANSGLFTADELLAAKDVFDMINNTGNN